METMSEKENISFIEWLAYMCHEHCCSFIDIESISEGIKRIRGIEDTSLREKEFNKFYWSDLFAPFREAFWIRRSLWPRLYQDIHCHGRNMNLYHALSKVISLWEKKIFDGLDAGEKKKKLLEIAQSEGIRPASTQFYNLLSSFAAPSIVRIDFKDIGKLDGRDKDVVRRGIFHDAKNHIVASIGLARHIYQTLEDIEFKEDERIAQKVDDFKQYIMALKERAENIEYILLNYLSGQLPPNRTVKELKESKSIQELKDILWQFKNQRERAPEVLIVKNLIRKDLKFCISNANRAIELIRMVTSVWLGWSMMNVNLHNFLDNLLEQQRQKLRLDSNIELIWTIDDTIPNRNIFLYDRILQTTLVELILNARKYSRASKVEVKVALIDSFQLQVIVSDNGVGIPSEILEKIFHPFTTEASSKHTGTGLGLPSLKDAIRSVGGEIEILTKPGEGTTFSFSLPINDMQATIPREKITGESYIIAITGLAGNHRKVVARWLAGELGLRYVNIGFLLRVLSFYLIQEKPHLIYSLKKKAANYTESTKIRQEIVLYILDFLADNRIDYTSEPVIIDGMDSAFTDDEGFSLRRKINEAIDGSKEYTELFHNLTNLCEVRQAINYFIGRLLYKIKRLRQHNGIVAIGAEPLQIADINIVLVSSVRHRGERKRTDPRTITLLDTATGGVRRIVHQIYLADYIIDTSELSAKDVMEKILSHLKKSKKKLPHHRRQGMLKKIEENTFQEEILKGCASITDKERINYLSYEIESIKAIHNTEEKIACLRDLYQFLNRILRPHLWQRSLWARLYLETFSDKNEYKDFISQGLCFLIDAFDENIFNGIDSEKKINLKIHQIGDEVIRELNLSPAEQSVLLYHLFVAYNSPDSQPIF
jgi:signal transduction histidine kinase